MQIITQTWQQVICSVLKEKNFHVYHFGEGFGQWPGETFKLRRRKEECGIGFAGAGRVIDQTVPRVSHAELRYQHVQMFL